MSKRLAGLLKKKYEYLQLIPIFVFSLLVLFNINNPVMNADESVTAMLGKNILQYGVPKAWDGKNLVLAGVNGNEFNESLVYIRDNWLAYYIAALGQLLGGIIGLDVFGKVLCMRILFAIINILGIFCFHSLVKDITLNKQIRLIALCLYATSIPAILHFRSIYYVSLIPTLVNSTFFFYRKVISKHSWKYCCLFILSSILLFHSLFVHFFIIIISILVIYVFFDIKNSNIKFFVVSFLNILLFTLPWWIYQRSFLNEIETNIFTRNVRFFETLLGYIWQINTYFFPFITVGVIALLFFLIKRLKQNKTNERKDSEAFKEKMKMAFTLFLPISFNVIVISFFSSFLETRWLFASIPFLFIIFAYILNFIMEQSRFIGIAVIATITLTNFFHIAPYLLIKNINIDVHIIDNYVKPPVPFYDANQSGWSNSKADLNEYLNTMCYVDSYLINYIEEISNDYHDADEGMILFLQKYANGHQTVMLNGYQYETLSFYTDVKVVNRLSPESNPQPNFYKQYPNAIRFEHLTYQAVLSCDWIIDITNSIEEFDWYNEKQFEKIYIDYPNTESWNEIWAHVFYTEYSNQGFYVYRNRTTTKEIELQGAFTFE